MFLITAPFFLMILLFFILYDVPPHLLLGLTLLVLLLLFAVWGFGNSCANSLIKKAIEELDENCDPYPLLHETQDQLTYTKSKIMYQLLLINHCAAMSCLGEYPKVVQALERINIDKYGGTLPITKVLYYHNLAGAYLNLGNLERGFIWYDKSRQILSDVKSDSQKKLISDMLFLLDTEILLFKKDYSAALELLEKDGQNASCKRVQVVIAALKARIFAAQGRFAEAKNELLFVIENGNKLFDVQEARQQLFQIEVRLPK